MFAFIPWRMAHGYGVCIIIFKRSNNQFIWKCAKRPEKNEEQKGERVGNEMCSLSTGKWNVRAQLMRLVAAKVEWRKLFLWHLRYFGRILRETESEVGASIPPEDADVYEEDCKWRYFCTQLRIDCNKNKIDKNHFVAFRFIRKAPSLLIHILRANKVEEKFPARAQRTHSQSQSIKVLSTAALSGFRRKFEAAIPRRTEWRPA